MTPKLGPETEEAWAGQTGKGGGACVKAQNRESLVCGKSPEWARGTGHQCFNRRGAGVRKEIGAKS